MVLGILENLQHTVRLYTGQKCSLVQAQSSVCKHSTHPDPVKIKATIPFVNNRIPDQRSVEHGTSIVLTAELQSIQRKLITNAQEHTNQ